MDERQVRWVCENASRGRRRRPARRAEGVGGLAREVVASPQVTGPAWRRRLLGVLAEEVGPELLEHATVVSVRMGVLTLEAAEPAALCHLRIRWEQPLLQLLQSRLPEAGINSVRFVNARNH